MNEDRPALRDIDFLISDVDRKNIRNRELRNRWLATLGRYGGYQSTSFHEDIVDRTVIEIDNPNWTQMDEQALNEYWEMNDD